MSFLSWVRSRFKELRKNSCARRTLHTVEPKQLASSFRECRVVSLPESLHRRNIESFVKNKSGRITLRPDLQNKFDKNAIKVLGTWQDQDGLWHMGQIGWLPSDVTFKIATQAPGSPMCAQIVKMSDAIDIRGPHVQIAIRCSQDHYHSRY